MVTPIHKGYFGSRRTAWSATRWQVYTSLVAGGIAMACLLAADERAAGARLGMWAVAGCIAFAAVLRLVTRHVSPPGGALGVANVMSIARLALIAPTGSLLLDGFYVAGAVVYVILCLTDVADGVIARRRGETTRFGIILDPLADILSTFAVFTVLVVDGFVPLWLYLLLLLRYLMLGVGSLVLSRTHGPIEFHATIPGKVVGVVQAAAVLWILRAAAAGLDRTPGDGPLFAFLGLGFVSIVVSQAIIGYRHIRRERPRARG